MPPSLPYYLSPAPYEGRLNPTLRLVPLDPSDGTLLEEPGEAVLVTGTDLSGVVRSYLSSATFGPDPDRIMVTLEASDAVGFVDRTQEIPKTESSFTAHTVSWVETAGNPNAIAIAGDGRSWVLERGTSSVAELPVSDAVYALESPHAGTLHALQRRAASHHARDEAIDLGRSLFYSAIDPRITLPGGGVSCNTCHFDGRNDGLTWAFDGNPRQTPSLVGGLSSTLPVTWTSAVATAEEEVVITSLGRMGGEGLTEAEASAIVAFIDALRRIDVPGREDPLVLQGAEIFERPEVGCAQCHHGPRWTDNGIHVVFGEAVNTPSLESLAATPPYLHDGSALTVREVLERSRGGEMGSTASLSDAEMDALEAWLLTL